MSLAVYFTLIKPVVSDHLSYVTHFNVSVKGHIRQVRDWYKTGLIIFTYMDNSDGFPTEDILWFLTGVFRRSAVHMC